MSRTAPRTASSLESGAEASDFSSATSHSGEGSAPSGAGKVVVKARVSRDGCGSTVSTVGHSTPHGAPVLAVVRANGGDAAYVTCGARAGDGERKTAVMPPTPHAEPVLEAGRANGGDAAYGTCGACAGGVCVQTAVMPPTAHAEPMLEAFACKRR